MFCPSSADIQRQTSALIVSFICFFSDFFFLSVLFLCFLIISSPVLPFPTSFHFFLLMFLLYLPHFLRDSSSSPLPRFISPLCHCFPSCPPSFPPPSSSPPPLVVSWSHPSSQTSYTPPSFLR